MSLKMAVPTGVAGDMSRRWGLIDSVNMDSTGADNDTLDFRGWAGGSILVPPGVTTITWYAAPADGGTFSLITDAGTAGVQSVTENTWAKIPDACFAHGFLRAVSNADPTGGADAKAVLKS